MGKRTVYILKFVFAILMSSAFVLCLKFFGVSSEGIVAGVMAYAIIVHLNS